MTGNNQQPGYDLNSQYNANQAYSQPQQRQWPHMTLGNWLVTFLLLMIPIANIVLMFVWAFGSNVNPSKKSYYQASLIMAAVFIGLMILVGGVLVTVLLSLLNSLS